MFRELSCLTLALAVITATVALRPAVASAQDGCGRGCAGAGEASTGPDGLTARLGTGGQPVYTSSGDVSNCVFSVGDPQANGVLPGVAIGSTDFGVFQIQDGTVFVWVFWECSDFEDPSSCELLESTGSQTVANNLDARRSQRDCDGDGVADTEVGDILNEIGNTEDLAALAFETIPWPELEILTYPEDERSIISGFEIPLLLTDGAGTTFESEFVAAAEDSGLIVTATATARVVEWDTSPINAQFGFGNEQFFACDNFGEAALPSEIAGSPCSVRWRGSSSGQVDNAGTAHRISLLSSVVYDIEYETNLAAIDVVLGEEECALEIECDGVPVSEIQVLHVNR